MRQSAIRWGLLVATVAGAGLAAALVAASGWRAILASLAGVGWAIVPFVLFHLLQLAASALAWRVLAGGASMRLSLRTVFVLRWVREGVNNLLPGAQIGGEVVAVRLLRRRGEALVASVASVTADLTMEMLTQIGFTLFCLALLLAEVGHAGPKAGAIHAILAGAVLALAGGAGFLALQLGGGLRRLEDLLVRLSARFGWEGVAGLAGLHAALAGLWRRRRVVAVAASWHGLSWLLGGVEVWIALRALGHALPLTACTAIEGVGQALKAAGFAVPGALGVQEGGYVLVCGFYGLPAQAGVALSLLKRGREIVFGVPGLLAWRVLESRSPALAEAGGTR